MYRVRYQLPDGTWSFWASYKKRTEAVKVGAKHSATYEVEQYESPYSALGRALGSIRTDKSRAASALNGKLGGRPKGIPGQNAKGWTKRQIVLPGSRPWEKVEKKMENERVDIRFDELDALDALEGTVI